MEFIEPSPQGYTIYTKEKCPYCDKVKQLLEKETEPEEKLIFLPCDDLLTTENDKEVFLKYIEEKAGVPYRTFPMVFLNGQFIGGFTDTKKHIENQKMFLHLFSFKTPPSGAVSLGAGEGDADCASSMRNGAKLDYEF